MKALRPGTALFWEAMRLPFNALLAMLAAISFEPLFDAFPSDAAWSYVWTPNVGFVFWLANVLYWLVHPLDALLQRSPLQGKESAGRVALWGGLALISCALMMSTINAHVGAVFF